MRLYHFGDVNRAVGAHLNLRVEVVEHQGARVRGQRAKKRQQNYDNDATEAGANHLAARGGYVVAPKLTFGTSRSAGALISKNCRGVTLNIPAMMLEGNCTIFVFRSRTTAL